MLGTEWLKSSYSGGGNDCIEARGWFTSTFTNPTDQDCVETNLDQPEIGIRDTKDRFGGQLTVSADAWRSFIQKAAA